jgi:hypothetical protein
MRSKRKHHTPKVPTVFPASLLWADREAPTSFAPRGVLTPSDELPGATEGSGFGNLSAGGVCKGVDWEHELDSGDE